MIPRTSSRTKEQRPSISRRNSTKHATRHTKYRLLPHLTRSNRPELLDGAVTDFAALAENLRDLRYADLLLGATRTLWRELRALLAPLHRSEPITLLDVATGDAHTPRRIAAYARRSGYALHPYASDVLVEVLKIGERQNRRTTELRNHNSVVGRRWFIEDERRKTKDEFSQIMDHGPWTVDDSWWHMAGSWCFQQWLASGFSGRWSMGGGRPSHLICHDALHIPAADGAFDIVTCSLALHHFGPAEAAALLRELARVARVGAVLIDLQRTWPAYLGAHLMAVGPWGTMARHDGPLSVLRAYTPDELRGIIEVSGVTGSVRVVSPLLISIVIAGGL